MSTDEQLNKDDFVLPAGVNLRECSVVIVGSTCRICGRDFKCITDVALHVQWRHNQIESVLNNDFSPEPDDHVENTAESPEYDVCDEHIDATLDLKPYKRQLKKQVHEKRRARKLRLIIKIAGVTMTKIRLSRKYLKVHSSEYLPDVSMQTKPHENETRQDDYGMNIDLSLADRVVGNSPTQYVQSHKATNRYTEGKLVAIQGDAIACSTGAPKSSPIAISDVSNGDAIYDTSDDSCVSHVYHREITSSQTRRPDTYVGSIVGTINVHDEGNSPRRRKLQGTNANLAAQDTSGKSASRSLYCQNNSPRDYPTESFIFQRVHSTGTARTAKSGFPDEPLNFGANRNHRCHPAWPNKRSRAINGLTDSSTEPIEIIIDNESDDNCDEDTKKHSTSLSTRTDRRQRSVRVDPAVDDDVQEILRITRGKVQDDINHESPNRTEREKLSDDLVRNALGQMYVASTQSDIIYPDKDNAILVVDSNVDSPNYPPCISIVEDGCQFPRDMAAFMYRTRDKALNIYLNKLREYGIEYYDNLPEINNNG